MQKRKTKKGLRAGVSLLLILAVLVSIFFGVNHRLFQKKQVVNARFETADWMMLLADDLPLAQVNLPGSHDAAAINPHCKDAFARHYTTISQQLESGIRLLDIRLQLKKNADGGFDFLTCHGNIGSAISLNTYQPFASLLAECTAFLQAHPKEALVMTLKVDDNRLETDAQKEEALLALKDVLNEAPIRPYQPDLGTVQEARGQIILFNRINSDVDFGYPMHWKDNPPAPVVTTEGDVSVPRSFTVGVQDYYNVGFKVTGFNTIKTDTFFTAVDAFQKEEFDVLFNFASACTMAFLAISPYEQMLFRLGAAPAAERPQRLGWVLMDYEDAAYKTDAYGDLDFVRLIIDSNALNGTPYASYPTAFQKQ